ncbi:hypothetical protein H310_12309 [Aphanomyces invadans]|uniref:MHD domain-containing protein n=1 Tax=Aphanomyces invadans TaxID=157072 RepID=A0A024TI48_9STRA|nr:hypothetical protein H310_12309 [Aphanomyces invadans]ETV93733.1 hypothetical protein H310_12309 [Aphanomyces invadans]|eukprot:XP_008877542.1 hypothetical protein H310_12309 [Aphanomyces invadans]
MEVATKDFKVQFAFPKSVRTADANTNSGSYMFDDSTTTLKWTVGKFNPKQHGAATLDEKPIVVFGSKVPFTTVCSLAVDTLVLNNENYKPYLGVRTLAQAGRFHES